MDPNEDLRRFRVAQRELAAEEVAIRQQAYATSSSRRVLGLIQQSNAVHRGMRPEEENVQLVQRFYHLAPPPLVFVGEYAKPVLDANAMSSMTHASAFNTDAIYRGFGNPTQEAEIALHEGVAAKYKARKIPAITPFTGSIFEAKPLDDPSPEEKELQAQEQAATDNDNLPAGAFTGAGAGPDAGPSASPSAGTNAGAGAGGATPLSAFSPGGAAGHLSTGDSLNLSASSETATPDAALRGQMLNFTSPTGLDAGAVAQGAGDQANLTAETGGSTLAAAQPDAPEPPPEVDSPNKIALKRVEAAKQAAEENARKAIDDAKIAQQAAEAAAEEAAKTFLGRRSPKNTRARAIAEKARQKAKEEQAKLKQLQLEEARLLAAVEMENQAAGVRSRAAQAAAAAAVEAARAPAASSNAAAAPAVVPARAPVASSSAAAAPAVVPALPPIYRKGSLSKKLSLTARFVQYVADVASQGVVAAPAAISSVVGAIASYAAEQYKSAETEPQKKAVLDGATAGFALARKTAEQEGLDLKPFERVIHDAATQALGSGATSALITGMEAAVNKSKTISSPPVPANLPPIFSPPKPSAAAAAAAEPLAAAEPPAAAAAAAKPSAAAAAAAPPAAAAAAVAADDVRSAVTEEYNKIEDSKFNMALPIVTLEAALIPTLTKLANAVGMTQAEVKQDAKYLANSVLLFQAKERRSIILSMIVRSMNVATSKLIGPGKLPASHQRPQRAHLAVADKVGPRSGVMGGFGKPASAKRPRFEKGSQEARDFMAQLRAKRQKK